MESSKTHARAQRERILDAARQRFIEVGFHAASVDSIAKRAGISTGLIYRYFQSKREIILAIIESQLDQSRVGLGALPPSTSLVDEMIQLVTMPSDPAVMAWNAVLFSEMTAEATRDTIVSEALQKSEKAAREEFVNWLARRNEHTKRKQSRKRILARALLMQCLTEGLIIRAVRDPHLDRDIVKDMLRHVMPMVLDA